jgi:hypothetical protein
MSLVPLWPFFHHGEKKMPPTRACCKGCVRHYMVEAKLWDLSDDLELDAIAKVVKREKITASFISCCLNFLNQCIYIEACTSVGSTRGEKSAFISHILGHRKPCIHAC